MRDPVRTAYSLFDDTVHFSTARIPRRLLNAAFPNPLTAAEEMEGELEAGAVRRNYRDTAGPVESQLYRED